MLDRAQQPREVSDERGSPDEVERGDDGEYRRAIFAALDVEQAQISHGDRHGEDELDAKRHPGYARCERSSHAPFLERPLACHQSGLTRLLRKATHREGPASSTRRAPGRCGASGSFIDLACAWRCEVFEGLEKLTCTATRRRSRCGTWWRRGSPSTSPWWQPGHAGTLSARCTLSKRRSWCRRRPRKRTSLA